MLRKNEFHPDQYEEYLANHHRHNMVVNILDLSFFMFGVSMVSMAVVLPAFLRRLGASSLVIGLLPAIAMLGISLPQVVMSFSAEGRLRHKPWCLILGIPQRVPWVAMGFFTVFFAETHPSLLIVLLLICFAVMNLSYGIVAPSHGELIGKAIPSGRRGIFMGLGIVSSGFLGFVGGVVVKFVMQSGRFEYPITYAVLFFAASAMMWVSYVLFALNREPILWPKRTEKDLREYIRSLGRILRNDHSYRRFIISEALASSRVMGWAIFMVYGLERFDLDDAIAGNFVMASTGATLVAALAFGVLADRIGHKFNMCLARALYLAAVGVVVLASDWRMMYLVFIFQAMSTAAHSVSQRNLIYQFSPEGRRPTYLALGGSLPSPFIIAFSLAGGLMADYWRYGYYAPFVVSMVFGAASLLILLLGVKVPKQPTDLSNAGKA